MATALALFESLTLFAASCVPAFFPSSLLLPALGGMTTLVGYALTFTACCVLAFYYNHLYDLRCVRNFGEYSRRLPQALGVLSFLLAGVYSANATLGLAAPPISVSLASFILPLALVLTLRGGLYAAMRTRAFAKRVMILGTGDLAQDISGEIDACLDLHYTIVGHVDDGAAAAEDILAWPYPILGPIELLDKIIEEQTPDLIVVALTEQRLRLPVWALLNARMRGIIVEDGFEVYERCTKKLAVERMAPSHLLFSRDFIKSRQLMSVRRTFSCTLATLGLILTAPLMGLIALAIKLDSGGPIFFVQDRAGLYGRTFRLVKFRTMDPTHIHATASVWERDVTAGITRVGKWLRRLYLDELPQFLNILRGDMDLIGPRPEMTSNVQTMMALIPYYKYRTAVRPGLTGWAQIKQGYAITQDEVMEKMRYDLYYLKHMSLRFDLLILLDTVKNVFLRRGT